MKIALITGVSRKEGIGYATAKQLGLQGFRVIVGARQLNQAEALAQDLGKQGIDATALRIDLLDRDSIKSAAKHVKEEFQKLDVLINNAALMLNSSATVQEKDMDELNREFETNVTG